MFLPVGEFMPDQPDFNNPGASEIKNVYPRTQQSYGPIAGLVTTTSAIDAKCQGSYPGIDTAGNSFLFAGNATKLYELVSGTTTWADVSKVGGYTIASDELWFFTQFGSLILATDFSDNIQSFNLNSSTKFADLSATAPKARYICTARDFVMVGNTYDAIGGAQPQRVWWSAIDDATNWPTPGTTAAAAVQSDYQNIPGDQGWIQGIVGNLGTADVAIFFERGIWRGVYVGSPLIFSFQPAEGVRGTPAPGSIAQLGASVFYLGEDGFYMFDGSNSVPIGANKVDKWFYANVNTQYLYNMTSAIDHANKLVFWAFPSSSSTDGHADTLLIYNWSLNRWSYADFNGECIFRSLTFGYTLETLDTLGYTLDTLPYSLDSRAWTGGSIILGAFDTSHKFGYFTGSNLAPTVETSEVEPGKDAQGQYGSRSFVISARPIVDGGTPSVSIAGRNRMIDATTYNTAIPINTAGECPQRMDNRYVRAQITLPAASTFNHISGVALTLKNSGKR